MAETLSSSNAATTSGAALLATLEPTARLMTFVMQPSERWHQEVPGARWFRADLHIHTLDDHPNPRLKRPADVTGLATDAAVQRAYARALLKAAVARGIEVLGLTPHAVRCGNSDETCATWRIVDVWNTEYDDDGVPFRDKIYAVFPGFEPSLSDGSRGVHLLFLFDPAIGKDCYLRAFQAVMGGVSPWNGNQLRNTGLNAEQVFAALDRLQREEDMRWRYLCLAPHAFSSEKGLFDLRSQILQDFPSDRLAGLELGDNQLPEEQLERRAWLGPAMSELGHAFFHSSDAYVINPDPAGDTLFEVGSRFTLVKLASPTIEALRQAFLASDSRLRIAFAKNAKGQMQLRADLPDPVGADRPWLRELKVSGGASFFGGVVENGSERRTVFRFSPDLTCVIGSRMAGKSTLLDGMRSHFGHPLPQEKRVRDDVQARAAQLTAGGAEVSPDIRGRSDPTVALSSQWPARFFTQRELQEAVRDQEGLRHILFHLLPTRAAELEAQHARLAAADVQLSQMVASAADLRTRMLEADQEFSRAASAKAALQRYREVGAERLEPAQRDRSVLNGFVADLRRVSQDVETVASDVDQLSPPAVADTALAGMLGSESDGVAAGLSSAREHLVKAREMLQGVSDTATRAASTAEETVAVLRQDVERALVAAGGSADELYQFDRLSSVAGEYGAKEEAVARLRAQYDGLMVSFLRSRQERQQLVEEHRRVMREVLDAIASRFRSTIRLRVEHEGDSGALEQWVRSLHEGAITRWWNDSQTDAASDRVGPERLRAALDARDLESVGMSERVAQRFTELVQDDRALELAALRAPDKYVLELQVNAEPPEYREMGRLSGGQQVSILLSLLLETDDPRPLVIDQPEDELDSGYLFDTVLPALRRLKGNRQIIFATHNANIVVNGDADAVIYLAGTYAEGRVAAQGAIEEPEVKEAILRTVDGGQNAFKLRHKKYGF